MTSDTDRTAAENLVRVLFPQIKDQLVGSIVVIATGLSIDGDDKIVSWHNGTAVHALGMVVVMKNNLLALLTDDDE